MTPEENVMRKDRTAVSQRRGEQGFTLIEALVAMVILVVGISAISNLMVVAGTSNTVANSTTAASAVAAQQMERLKSATYQTLVPGGTVTLPVNHGVGHPDCDPAVGPAVTAVYLCDARIQGVGTIHVQWQIVNNLPGAPQTYFINVLAQPVATGIGLRGQARFTTFRTSN